MPPRAAPGSRQLGQGLSQAIPTGVRGQADTVCTRSPGRAHGNVPAGRLLPSGAPGTSSPHP